MLAQKKIETTGRQEGGCFLPLRGLDQLMPRCSSTAKYA